MISESTFQLTNHQVSGKAIKILLPFLIKYLYEARFPSYTSKHNRLNAEVVMRVQQSSVTTHFKETCKK